ncbi:MAG: hypothetical protein KH009_08820 [Clostridiales bacterium]|nr:hypothetical protein [Clostridiales bacterium]
MNWRILIVISIALTLFTGCESSPTICIDEETTSHQVQMENQSNPDLEITDTIESIQLDIPLMQAALDENGNLNINSENTDIAKVNWIPINGYTKADSNLTTDQLSPGIQNDTGKLILDYIYLIHADGIDVIDYESNLLDRLELFSQVINSKNYKCFISAMPNGGGGWVNKNGTSEDRSTYYGYLINCKVKLNETDFLCFHYYFQSDFRYQTYEEIPDGTKEELLQLIDSFRLI